MDKGSSLSSFCLVNEKGSCFVFYVLCVASALEKKQRISSGKREREAGKLLKSTCKHVLELRLNVLIGKIDSN